MALTERIHSDGAIPPRRRCFLLMYPISQILQHSENALAESESALLSSRGVWEHLEVLRSTGEVAPSVCEDWVSLPDRFTFC